MLKELFPRSYTRYTSLPVLGPLLDGFAAWMHVHRYSKWTLYIYLRTMVHLDRSLRSCAGEDESEITRGAFEACWSALRERKRASGVHCLHQYLVEQKLIPPPLRPAATSLTDLQLAAYRIHLRDVRGLSPNTIRNHLTTATQFLTYLGYECSPSRLTEVVSKDIEAFVQQRGQRLTRGSLQHVIAHLRGFLRFLATDGVVGPGLDAEIDTPRTYRFEQLPRALPWGTVRTFLQSIDRSTPIGLRDYTMFFLIATYGLRAIEIVSLTLDDLDWRKEQIRVPQRKTGTSLLLPLTDAAGNALLDYLRRYRRRSSHRELFLRTRPPIGPLQRNAVGMKFNAWAKRSGLEIPTGTHCLRHSYAAHLLRLQTPLKTIGDLLGHRDAESTSAYLRLATEDLRDVALAVPTVRSVSDLREVGP